MRLPALICIVILLVGCDGGRAEAPATGLDAGSRIAAKELDQLCYAFADRYLALMASACDALVVDEADPLKRRAARRLKLSGCTAVYDIATARDPFSKLLDLTLVVTLQSRVWIDEDQAVRSFGERGRVLVRALRQARVEIWQVASRALFQPQLQELDWLIWDWRRRNPAVTEIAAVRFDEASAVRGRALADAVRSGGGLLAPISDAVTQIDESRELAERAFFQAKRLPMLIDWQVQGTLDDVLLRPEVATALTSHGAMVQSIEKLTAIAAEIPAVAQRERQAALDAIGGQVQSVRGLVDEVRKAIADVTKILADVTPLTASGERIVVDLRETSQALTQTITAADALLAKVSGGPPAPGAAPGKPFDIAEYAAVVGDLAKMVKELNALVGSSNNLLGSNVLSARLKEVNSAAAERVEHASLRVESVVAMVFVRLALLLVLGFVLLLAYRWLAPRVAPKRGGA